MYYKKRCIGKEKDALRSEKVKYFGIKFEYYKAIDFRMDGVVMMCIN